MFITENKNNYYVIRDSTSVLLIRNIINVFKTENKNNYYVINGYYICTFNWKHNKRVYNGK